MKRKKFHKRGRLAECLIILSWHMSVLGELHPSMRISPPDTTQIKLFLQMMDAVHWSPRAVH